VSRQNPSSSQPIDLAALSPVERIALADVLYDGAMQEIDGIAASFSPEELAELDRRIADVEQGRVELFKWDEIKGELLATL
jgi:putative addiction module component (TIGR02574 family)